MGESLEEMTGCRICGQRGINGEELKKDRDAWSIIREMRSDSNIQLFLELELHFQMYL